MQTAGDSPSASSNTPPSFKWRSVFDKLRQRSEEAALRSGTAENPILLDGEDDENVHSSLGYDIAPPTPATLANRTSPTPTPENNHHDLREPTASFDPPNPYAEPVRQEIYGQVSNPDPTRIRPVDGRSNSEESQGVPYSSFVGSSCLPVIYDGSRNVDTKKGHTLRKTRSISVDFETVRLANTRTKSSASEVAGETFTRVTSAAPTPLTISPQTSNIVLAPGDVYWHAFAQGHQYWIRQRDDTWKLGAIGAPHPVLSNRRLTHTKPVMGKLKGKGPIWILESSLAITKRRRAQRAAAMLTTGVAAQSD